MSWLVNNMRQTATWWALSSRDDYGDPTFSTPVSLAPGTDTGVRWENKVEKFISQGGDEDYSRAVVYCTTELAVGDYLYLGTSTEADPDDVDGADQIRMVGAVPNIRNRYTLYRVLL